MSGRVPVLLALLALLGGALLAGASPVAGPVATPAAGQQAAPNEAPTTVTMTLAPNGDATVTIETRFDPNRTDAAAFRTVADQFRSGQRRPWIASLRSARAAAADATGREMALHSVERSATVANRSLRLSATWTNVARATGERYVLADVFNGSAGTWLDGLTARQSLVVELPPGYGVLGSSEGARTYFEDGRTHVAWTGDQTFEAGDLRIVYSGQAGGPWYQSPMVLGAAAVAGVALLGAAVLVYRRRDPTDENGVGPAGDAERAAAEHDRAAGVESADGATASDGTSRDPPGDGSVDGASQADGTAPSDDVAAAGAAAADDGATGAHDGSTGADEGTTTHDGSAGTDDGSTDAHDGAADEDGARDDDSGIDETLLSDEERVELLLQRNGGRMKQARIVEETGWSNAKVSQLLSGMAEDGQVDKLRIGRENLIADPEEDITDIADE